MKKIVKFILPFLVASSAILSGCKKKESDNRVLLTFGDIHATESREVTIKELANSVKNDESFLLVINSVGCGCWSSFRPNLNAYLSKYHGLCYRMDYYSIKDYQTNEELNLPLLSESTTTFLIYENGERKTYLCTDDDEKIMYSKDKFEKYMNETVQIPNCYLIAREDINTIKSSGKNAVIYVERNGCGDCAALNKGILKKYIKEHGSANTIYAFDAEKYRGTDQYDVVKAEFGMTEESNPTYGYTTGVFPFFSFISNGAYSSGSVIYNEHVSEVDGKYVIDESYYTSERAGVLEYTDAVLLNKEIPSSDVIIGDYGPSWDKDKADEVYGPILNSFLDTYLPRVDFSF